MFCKFVMVVKAASQILPKGMDHLKVFYLQQL